ncbi:MAG: maleylpyruvate isomerase N-terminal domain-containing protein [Actinomycetota bacterium]
MNQDENRTEHAPDLAHDLARDLARDLAGATASHRRLIDAVQDLGDPEAAAPSLLANWSVGHVLTHLARNADSHVRMIAAAEAGTVADQYEDGTTGRAAEIERGAHRPAAELVDDVVSSIDRLEACWGATSPAGWAGEGMTVGGLAPISDLPFRRWRETEVHHFDLGLGSGLAYGIGCWPDDYVRLELGRLLMQWSSRLPMGLTQLPVEATAADDRTRLGWLLGRIEIVGLPPAGIFR